ncbi:MAG: hypothetical protein AB2A00_28995 [Myxococcota bacterium]
MRCLFVPLLAVLCVGCLGEEPELGRVAHRVWSEPEHLRFDDTRVGTHRSAVLTLRSEGAGALHLGLRVEPADSAFGVDRTSATVTAGQAAQVTVSFLAAVEGPFHGELVVTHDGEPDDDGSREVRVPLSALAVAPPDCDDGNPCTLDQPDPVLEGVCLHVPIRAACDDGNACTHDDTCEAGLCVGLPISCNDDVACTADSCDPGLGCVHLPTAALCDDGDPCTQDACTGDDGDERGCIHPVAVDGTLCGVPSCAEMPVCVMGQCHAMPAPDGFPCEDGDPCTQGDSCHAGSCTAGAGGALTTSEPVVLQEVWVDDAETPPPLDAGIGAGMAQEDAGAERRHDEESPDAGAATSVVYVPDQPLWGQWPVSLDGMAMLWRDAINPNGDEMLVLWRGSSYPGGCLSDPAACTVAPACAPNTLQATDTATRLNLTLTTTSGMATNNHTLDLDDIHRRSAGAGNPESPPAPGSVANAAGVATVEGMVGAAIVNYASNCTACTTNDITDGTIGCTPEGPALAVFRAWPSGFNVEDALWLGGGPEAVLLPNLVRGRDGLPLLAVTEWNRELFVAYALHLPGSCVTPDCDCNLDCDDCCDEPCPCQDNITLVVRRYLLDASEASMPRMLFAAEQHVVVSFQERPDAEAGFLSSLRMDHVDGRLHLTWLQDSEVIPQMPECEPSGIYPYAATMSAYDAWVSTADDSGVLGAPSLLRSRVGAVGYAQDAGGTAILEWSRVGVGDFICAPIDTLVATRGEDGEELMQRVGPGEQNLTAARAQMLLGRATLLAVDARGTLAVAAAPAAGFPATVATGGWNGEANARLWPGAAPRGVDVSVGAVVGAVAEIGIWNNAMPRSGLVITQVGCGLGNEP